MRTVLYAQILLCSLLCTAVHAEIVVKPVVAMDSKLVAEVQRTADAFNAIAGQKLGVTLNHDITIRLCPTEECYIGALINEANFKDDQARLIGRVSGGYAYPGKNVLFIKQPNTSAVALAFSRFTTAHELTHMVQGQLAYAPTAMEKANRWLKEGMADWVGAQVASKLGNETFEKWKLERVNRIRSASNVLEPRDMDGITMDTWAQWMDEKRLPYEMADLMVMTLADKNGDNMFSALTGYMQCMNTFSFESTCFQKNFGIEQRAFYEDFGNSLQRIYADGKRVEIIADGIPDVSTSLVDKTYAQTQSLLRERLGSELPISLRIFLLPDRAAMSTTIARELGHTTEEASKMAAGTASMWQDSIVFFDAGRLDTSEKLAFITASTTTGRYLQVAGSSRGQLSWMAYGLREYIANTCIDALGIRSQADSLQARTDILRKASKGLPTLTELETNENYRNAQKKYGSTVVAQYAAAAVYELVAEKGVAALGGWIRASKAGTDPSSVFADSIGESLQTFGKTLDTQIKSSLHI